MDEKYQKKAFKTLQQILEEYHHERLKEIGIEPNSVEGLGGLMEIMHRPEAQQQAQRLGDKLVKRLSSDDAFHDVCHDAASGMLKTMAFRATELNLPADTKVAIVNFLKDIDDHRPSFHTYEMMFADSIETWEEINRRFEKQMPKVKPNEEEK